MAPPFAQQTKKTTTQSSTSGGPPGLTSSRRAGPSAPPSKSRDQIAKELDREITRRTYFDGRQDVSDDRLDRRLAQAQEYQKFKSDPTKTKLVSGSTNLYQAATPGGITLTDKQIQLANKYGPTFSEIMSDVTYASGKTLGALGERAMSGGLGFLGAIKEVANYALNKANQGYDKLNSVQQEIFDNPDKYPYASKVPQVEAVNNSRELALEADRDALGLELDALLAEREANLPGPTVDLRSAKDYIDYQISRPSYETTQPVFPAEEVKEAAMDRFSPEYLEEQKRLLDELNVMPTVEELQTKEKSELGILDLFNPFDEVPIQMGINEMINPGQVDIEKFKEEMNQGSLSTDDGTQVTAYNNFGNLQFAGQQEAIEGQTYGNNFAVFPNAEAGITALKNDLTAKVNRSNKVDDIIGEYAPKVDNPESFNNYLSFVKNTVGETVEPNEIDDLTRSVIQFENKPDIANQYLTMVADGGMIDKQLKSLQNGLQNMYNGIPSVKRR